MGQWSKPFNVGKAEFLAHAKTAVGGPFSPVTSSSIVDFVMLMDDGGEPEAAATAIADLEAKMVGKPVTDRPPL